jgi:Glycosyltransferase family 87
LKLVTFVATFVIVARLVQGRPGRLILASLLVTGGYVVEEFRNGNAHSLVLWLMVVAFAGAERGQSVIPGAALAAAIATKIAPLALLAYFGVRRAIPVCVATVVSLAVIWQIPSVFWGPATTAHLTDGFLKYSFLKLDEPLSAYNYSLRGALINFASSSLTPEASTGIGIVAAAAAAIVVAWVIRSDHAHPGTRALELALVLTAIPLFSPHSQRIHFAGLAVPAAILWAVIRSEPALPFRRLGMGALAVNALASTFVPLLLPARELSLAYLELSPYAFATLFLFVALLLTAIGLKRPHFILPSRIS